MYNIKLNASTYVEAFLIHIMFLMDFNEY